jgi:hypothetical protein
MKKFSPALPITLLCLFMLAACGSGAGEPARIPDQPVFARDAASSYSSEFRMQFSGQKSWTYLLKTHKTPAQREISLHIEGLEGAQNPGDVRQVTDNVTTWMIGPGTDQQCVQFPNGKGMDPTYLYPESLVSLKDLGNALSLVGETKLEGVALQHFYVTGAATGPWKDAIIDLVQEKDSGMLRQFKMTAMGQDPFFSAGLGKMSATYTAGPPDSTAIQSVEGCETGLTLPEPISMYVRLPGMASFESKSSVADLVQFFQTTLPGQNWVEKEPPAQSESATVLSYQRGTDGLEIHIEKNPAGGSKVKLLFIPQQ